MSNRAEVWTDRRPDRMDLGLDLDLGTVTSDDNEK